MADITVTSEHLGQYNAKRRGQCYTAWEMAKNEEFKNQLARHDTTKIQVREIGDPTGIIQFLKCGYCGNLPTPPLVVCHKGHILCGHCGAKVGGCIHGDTNAYQKCGEPVRPVELQFYTYLFNNSVVSCAYSNLGCPERCLGSALRTHYEKCLYRQSIRCPVSGCFVVRIAPRDYKRHLLDHNETVEVKGPVCNLRVLHVRKVKYPDLAGDYRWTPSIINYQDLDFVIVIQESIKEVYIWACFVSTDKAVDGRTFLVKFNISHPITKRVDYEWSGEVLPMKKSMDRIPRSENCFLINKQPFEKNYLYEDADPENDKCYFDLTVTILEAPAPEENGVENGQDNLENDEGEEKLWSLD